MKRRDLLGLVGASIAARWAAGCDRLVVLDRGRRGPIPPITSNEDHYTYAVFGVPEVDPEAHRTVVAHEEDALGGFDLAFVESLPSRDREHTLECIGAEPINLAISNAVWSGLPLREVLDVLGIEVPPSAVGLRLVGADRNAYSGEPYHAGLPIADLDDGPVWLVWRMNGEPVPLDHGAPYRLLVPGRYGVKNVKWPVEIAFVDTAHESFWTGRGWDEAARYQANTLVLDPPDGVLAAPGERLRFAGTAFAGSDPVVRVEVSLDGGPWREASIDYGPGPDIWALWSWDWVARAGEHRLQVRCVTASGARSQPDPAGTDPVGSSRVDLQACKLEYSIVSPK